MSSIITLKSSEADFIEIGCSSIEMSDQGLRCEFNNILLPELTKLNVIELNTSIESVSFHQSQLYTLPQDIFAKFPSLKHIDAEMTHLKVISADNFRSADELKYFLARFNDITNLESETFIQAPKLKFIVLQYNEIMTIHPHTFKGLNFLEALYLDFNRITSLSDNILDFLPNLLHLSLSFNNLTSISNGLFMKTTKLETLNFGHNLLTHFNDSHFDYIPNLERLQLDHNKLKNLDLVACKSTEIDVSDNELEVIELSKWTKTLSAWGNSIKKLILHEHYGAQRKYNFSFKDVNEIVFFVHEHCCAAESLENFQLLTESFGDLSSKNLKTNEWLCVFLKSIGYETSNGFVVNNVCTKMSGMLPSTISTIEEITVNVPNYQEDFLTSTLKFNDDYEIEELSKNYTGINFDNVTSDDEIAIVKQINATENYENGIWKSLKSKAKNLKESFKNKWNTWIG